MKYSVNVIRLKRLIFLQYSIKINSNFKLLYKLYSRLIWDFQVVTLHLSKPICIQLSINSL